MRLITFQINGEQRLGAFIDKTHTRILDLTTAASTTAKPRPWEYKSMQALIDAGPAVWEHTNRLLENPPPECVMEESGTRILPPLPCPRRMRDFSAFETHAASAGQVPEIWYRWPLYYKVNTYAIVGPDSEVTWPDASTEIDYELEIAAVIGKPGRGVAKEQAREHIFGFTIFNDLSARDWQRCEFEAPLGPSRSKDFDGANVIGPCIVTLDEIPDIYALEMTAQVNGEEWSRGNTRTLYHSFEDMIAFVSESETLVAGELFGSGTVGSGCGMELGRFLARGDTVQLTVEHLGSLSTVIR